MSSHHPALSLDHPTQADLLVKAYPVLVEKIRVATQLESGEEVGMLTEVLRFLSLIAASNKVLTPPLILDLAWHEFILFTKVYGTWCNRHLGRFIHHTPGGTQDENNFQLRRTLKLYNLYFGRPDPRFWGEHGYLSEPAHCGSCDGE